MKDHETVPMIPIRAGIGVWLEDFAGKRYLDAISSWWVNLFGHANPRINAAVAAQLGRLEHVILAGLHARAGDRLAEELMRIAPRGLTRCFFADNGSSAIEVALKMSFHFWRNRGQPRRRASSRSPTAITARRWARSRSATWSSTSPSTGRC